MKSSRLFFNCLLFFITVCCTPQGFAQVVGKSSSLRPADIAIGLLYPPKDTFMFNPPLHVPLRWAYSNDFESYFVDVATDPEMMNLIKQDVVVFLKKDSVEVSQAHRDYYWRVRTQFDSSLIGHFSVQIPDAIRLVKIYNGDTLLSDTVHFTWHRDSLTTRYEVVVYANDYSDVDTVMNDTTHTMIVPRGKKLNWRVRALYSGHAGLYSVVDSFYVETIVGVSEDLSSNNRFVIHADASYSTLLIEAVEFTSSPTDFRIFNSRGERILSADFKGSTSVKADINSLSAGLYFVQCSTAHGSSIQKLLIQR